MEKEERERRNQIRSLVNEIYDTTVSEARERVWAHRFTRDLEAGTLPIEVIRGLICNLSTWAMEINASSRRKFGHHAEFYARYPDLERLLSDKAADEFTTPGPGGHQPTVYRLGAALGLTREQMVSFHLIPATRGYLDSIVWRFETGSVGGINITEEWYADWAKVWSKALMKHYGLSREDVFYWDLHAEADSLDEHGATEVEHHVMGHGMSNRYLSWRLLQEGVGDSPNLRERWIKSARQSVEQFLLWVEANYDTYDPRVAGKQPVIGESFAPKAEQADSQAVLNDFMVRGQRLMEEKILRHPFVVALAEGSLPRSVVARFHEQWYRVVRRMTGSYVGLYYQFIHIYKMNPDLEAQVTLRIGNEVEYPVTGGRPRALDPLLKALGSSPEQALKTGLHVETDFLVSFFGRLYSQGTFAEVNANQIGSVIAPFARLCRQSLIDHYGVAPESCAYWDTYTAHDSAERGGGALGTAAENQWALKRIYELGLVTERPGWGVDYIGDMSIHLWDLFLTGCQRHLS